jgi:hypothetical protein
MVTILMPAYRITTMIAIRGERVTQILWKKIVESARKALMLSTLVAIKNLITSDAAPTGTIYDVNRLTAVVDIVLKLSLKPPPSKICHDKP